MAALSVSARRVALPRASCIPSRMPRKIGGCSAGVTGSRSGCLDPLQEERRAQEAERIEQAPRWQRRARPPARPPAPDRPPEPARPSTAVCHSPPAGSPGRSAPADTTCRRRRRRPSSSRPGRSRRRGVRCRSQPSHQATGMVRRRNVWSTSTRSSAVRRRTRSTQTPENQAEDQIGRGAGRGEEAHLRRRGAE